MRSYRIMIEYTAPARKGTNPNKWDWSALLDIAEDEEFVVKVEEIETPASEE